MATNSAYNEIKRKITSSKRGTLFFPDSFAQMASSDAIRSALVRLCKDGDIIRVAQGIYCYPKIDTKWGSGVVPPSIEDIANGIAKRDKVTRLIVYFCMRCFKLSSPAMCSSSSLTISLTSSLIWL